MVATSDLALVSVELLGHHLGSHCRQLLHEILRGVIKSDKHDVEIAVEDAEIKVEAELLFRRQLLDSLHVFKLER